MPPAKTNSRLLVTYALIILVAGGIVAISLSLSFGPAGAPAGATVGVPGFDNPQPWQYNAATNQHWDPSHAHWHAGPPPADRTAAAPSIEDPQPWEYDPATNKHWQPDHGHWHDGPPPPEGQRTLTGEEP